MNGFDGRVVLVTGGAAGIGAACVKALVEAGANTYSLDHGEPLDPINDAHYCCADLRDTSQVNGVLAAIDKSEGHLDVLINNAGVSFVGTVEEGTEDQWNWIWDVNVLGYVRSIRAALPLLRRSTTPTIVNISSCTARSGFRKRVLYSATKGAIEALTRSIAADLVDEGITVNAVSPGTVDTPFMTELAERAEDPSAQRRHYEERQPTGRMILSEEVAHAVMYLSHPHNRSSIGTVVTIDGGIAGLHLTRA